MTTSPFSPAVAASHIGRSPPALLQTSHVQQHATATSPPTSWFPSASAFSFSVAEARRTDGADADDATAEPAADRPMFSFEQLPRAHTRSSSEQDEFDDAATLPSAFAQALASTRHMANTPRAAARTHAIHSHGGHPPITPYSMPSRTRTLSGEGLPGSNGGSPASVTTMPQQPRSNSRHNSTPGAGAAAAAAAEAATASLSHGPQVLVTNRLPPRIPSSASMTRLSSINRLHAHASHSSPSTPFATGPHMYSYSAAHLVSPPPPPAVSMGSGPSLGDLVSPAEAPDKLVFASWNSNMNHMHQSQQRQHQQQHSQTQPSSPMDSRHDFSASFNTSATASVPAMVPPISREWRALLSRPESIEHVRSDPAVHALIATGVPASVRPALWKLLSGSNEERRRHPPDYYRSLLAVHRQTGSTYDDEIRRDLARTLPSLELFNPRKQPADYDYDNNSVNSRAEGNVQPTGCGGLHRLQRILQAYATRNKSLGYCQGMNFLCGTLLTLFLQKGGDPCAAVQRAADDVAEEDVFWIFVRLVESRLSYYCKSMVGLEVDQLVFTSLVSYYLPELHDHLKAHSVTVASFTVSWFVCLFVEAPLQCMDEVYLVWDRLLACSNDDEFLFAFSLGLVRCRSRDIIRRKDSGELMEFLLHSGFKTVGSAAAAGGGTPGPSPKLGGIDIRSLLAHDVPALGSLSKDIASLRALHRNEVLAKSRVLNHHAAQRLAAQFKFPGAAATASAPSNAGPAATPTTNPAPSAALTGAQQVQQLWSQFLDPDPWGVLLYSSLTSEVSFLEAFCSHVFPAAVRSQWRDQGLVSGLVARMFAVVDSDGLGEVRFESFLAAVHLFQFGEAEERCRFLFRVYDVDGDGRIGFDELKQGLEMFQKTFQGARMPGLQQPQTPRTAKDARDAAEGGATPENFGRKLSSSSIDASNSTQSHSNGSSADVSTMFATTMFQRASESHRAHLLVSAEKTAGIVASKAGLSVAATAAAKDDALSKVPSIPAILQNLYLQGLTYTQFRRVINLHPFSQLSFNLMPAVPGAASVTAANASHAPTVKLASAASSPKEPPSAAVAATNGTTTPASAAAAATPAQDSTSAAQLNGASMATVLSLPRTTALPSGGGLAAAAASGTSAGSSAATLASSSFSLLSSLDRSPPAALAAGLNAGRSRSGSLHLAMSATGAQSALPVRTVTIVVGAPPTNPQS